MHEDLAGLIGPGDALEPVEQPLAVLTFPVDGKSLDDLIARAAEQAHRVADGRPFEMDPIEAKAGLMRFDQVEQWRGEVTIRVYAPDEPE